MFSFWFCINLNISQMAYITIGIHNKNPLLIQVPAPPRSPHLCLCLSGLFFEVVFGYVTALAPSYEVFALSRFLVGLMNGGINVSCFVLTQEYVGKSYWAMTGM